MKMTFLLIFFVAGWAQKAVAHNGLRAVTENKECETVEGLTFWVADENRDQRRDAQANSLLTSLVGVFLSEQSVS